jgi:hypothetical protein
MDEFEYENIPAPEDVVLEAMKMIENQSVTVIEY